MVPIGEMIDTLKVIKDVPRLNAGSYVRIRRPLVYQGDLGRVEWIEMSQNQVCVSLVPRIDYGRKRGVLRDPEEERERKKRHKRPPQKLFDADAVKAIGGDVTTDGDMYIFEGNQYCRGLLNKTFPLHALDTDGIKPTLAELEKFQDSGSDELQNEREYCTLLQPSKTIPSSCSRQDDSCQCHAQSRARRQCTRRRRRVNEPPRQGTQH